MNELLEQIWRKKVLFLVTFFIVFTCSYIILVAIDLLPEPPAEEVAEEEVATALEADKEGRGVLTEVFQSDEGVETDEVEDASNIVVLPTKIVIEKLGKTVNVSNPTSRSIADLDEALLSGVVRHPDSATLSQEGNVFILGHSSYLPKVFNKNFQAFNGIQNLEWGDTIEVYSEDKVFEYRVEKVYRARAQDVTVPIAGTGKILTLATCNSFGTTDDRYIVEATQTSQREL